MCTLQTSEADNYNCVTTLNSQNQTSHERLHLQKAMSIVRRASAQHFGYIHFEVTAKKRDGTFNLLLRGHNPDEKQMNKLVTQTECTPQIKSIHANKTILN